MRVSAQLVGLDEVVAAMERFPKEFRRAKKPVMARLGSFLAQDLRGRILQKKFDVDPNAPAWQRYKQRAGAGKRRPKAEKAWEPRAIRIGYAPKPPKSAAERAAARDRRLRGAKIPAYVPPPKPPPARAVRAGKLSRYVDPLTWTGGYAKSWRASLDANGGVVLAPIGAHPVTGVPYGAVARWLEYGTKRTPRRPHLVPFGEEIRRTALHAAGHGIVVAALAAARRR